MTRSMLLRRGVCGVLACAFLGVVPAAAAGTLDQSQPVIGNGLAFVGGTVDTAQTFTNGLTGLLDQVDVAVTRSSTVNPLRVEIRTAFGGVPTTTVLASAEVPETAVPLGGSPSGFLSVPIAPSVPVTAGVQYAIVLSTTSCGFLNCYQWSFTGPNPYAAGAALQSVNSGPWGQAGFLVNTDTAFKTYVAQAPTRKADCKKGGWRHFANPTFKNQGQCVAYVNHHDGKGKDDNKAAAGKKGKGKKP